MREAIDSIHGRRRPRVLTVAVLAAAAFALLATPAMADEAPKITSGPTISNMAPRVGDTLTAKATWTPPDARATYRWQRCAGRSGFCTTVATGPTYVVVGDDLNRRLQVRLDVVNDGNEDAKTSERTQAVAPALPAAPPAESSPEPSAEPAPPRFDTTGSTTTGGQQPAGSAPAPGGTTAPDAGAVLGGSAGPRMLSPFPTVRIRGMLTAGGARITLLTVRAPSGTRIAVRCFGSDCPARRWTRARATRLTRIARFQRRLAAGTRLVITVTRRNRIGKHTTIVIRRGKAPFRRDRCLPPGATKPVSCGAV